MKKLFTYLPAVFTCLFISCSSDSDTSDPEELNLEDIQVEEVVPSFGYIGDEISLNMSSNFLSSSEVSILYGNEKAKITAVTNKTIKHIVPDSKGSYTQKLFVNGHEVSFYLNYLNKFIDCPDCIEKAYSFVEDEVESAITDVYQNNDKTFLIQVSRNNNYDYSTTLLITDHNFNIQERILLFNKLPISKALFEGGYFVIANEEGVFSFDTNGEKLWSYETPINSGMGSTYIGYVINSIVSYNSSYYVIKNPQGDEHQIEIIKLDQSGNYLDSILIPNPHPADATQTAYFLTVLDNRMVLFTSFCCDDSYGYVVIDAYDNILNNTYNAHEMRDADFFTEGTSVYFSRYNEPVNELVKMTLGSDNYFTYDWTRSNYTGIIEKYKNKYLIVQNEEILVFNDNNFESPTVFIIPPKIRTVS